jgi:hypothetical protein
VLVAREEAAVVVLTLIPILLEGSHVFLCSSPDVRVFVSRRLSSHEEGAGIGPSGLRRH